ncbi:MAG: HAD family hydrolase, partial [Pseudomonadota bacterium]
MRIAMWSGPRNMSTTMMRSFGARADTACVDEPFYAAYLKQTGLRHPMSDEIFASQSTDPAAVAQDMTGCPDPSVRIFYQKHMTHHMLPDMSRDWMAACRNVFLIRHPARVIASYARKMGNVSLEAIGFPQQLSLFETA